MPPPPIWDNLPAELKELRHWVLWKPAERDGKPTKIPIRADSGLNAESDDLTTWTTFDNAKAAFEKGRGGAAGIGFVFARASEISGVDLDRCRDPSTGEIDAWAKAYLDRLNSYTEISPSGTGLHVIVKASEGIPKTGEDGGRQKGLKGNGYGPGAKVEMYSNKRYFTMTGNRLAQYPATVESRQDELLALYSEVFGPAKPDTHQITRKPQDGRQDKPTGEVKEGTTPPAGGLSDKAVIARMLGSANAGEIEKLLAGDTTAYGGDDSAADLALANHLCFWTGKDRQQMDRIFRSSGLMRDKWDEKRGSTTYGERTISAAIEGTTEVYQPERTEDTTTPPVDLPGGIRRWSDDLPPGVPGVDQDGVIYCRQKKTAKGGEVTYKKVKVCDGYARISTETRDDQGEATFTVEGMGSRDGHIFKFDIPGRDFSDSRKLKAALVAHFGARNRIRELTGDHIQSLSLDVEKKELITAPKWSGNTLAIPGLDVPGVKFDILRRLPVDLSTGEVKKGGDALRLLLRSWPKEKAALLVCTSLAAPLCGRWFKGDRFGIALVGTTGRALKTEALKHALAIYGEGFLDEESLLKWNEGATTNAMLAIIAGAGCLPVGLDNFKTTSRDSAGKFVSTIHTVLEGRERERLTRNAKLRETREYAATLIVTGEDLPEEASTVARMLPIEWTRANTNRLTELQKIAHHLPAVGRMWCKHLTTMHAVDMDAWRESRAQLVKVAEEAGAVNPGRIGTTASIMRLVWTVALDSPLGDTLRPYTADFEAGLTSLILATSQATAGATEAAQFVDALKELVVSGRCRILEWVHTGQELTLPNVIGWRLSDKGEVAILPQTAIDAVRRVIGPQAQTVGNTTLYRQLEEAGCIEPGKNQRTPQKRVGSKVVRVLVFKPGVLMDDGILDHVNIAKSATLAAEDADRQKKSEAIAEKIKKAVSVG